MKIFKRTFCNFWDLILFFTAVTIKTLIYGEQISVAYFKYSHILYPVIASTLIVLSFLVLLKNKNRFKALFILDLIISIVIICDINYYRYFKDILSLSVVRNSILLGSVKSSVSSIFKLTDLLFLTDLILFLIINKFISITDNNKFKFKFRLALFILVFCLGSFMNYLYFNKLSIEQPRLLSTMYNRVYIAKELGIINAHGVDAFNEIKNSIDRHTLISKEKVLAIKDFLGSNSKNNGLNLKDAGKGKNLIMIQVEALQGFVINKTIDGKEITPNLNRWIKRSAYFKNFFYQVSAGGTSDAEFMSNNSLYPAPYGAAYYLYYKNQYNSLGRLFKNNGYNTAAFHGYKGTFWNRDVMYVSESFDKFYSERDYNVDKTIGLGLADESFLNQSLEKIKTMQKPFYSFLITLSSHFPYDDKAGYGTFNTGAYENSLIGDYLRGIHYTDEALGKFLDNLEKEKLLDDSIVVIYGDHNAIPKDKQDELAKFMNITNMNEAQWATLQKVPMLIHFPKDENEGTYETFGGEMDILPTLCNLFSLDNSDTLGKDLFNTRDNTVIYRNGSFIDNSVYYSSQDDAFFDIKKISPLPENDVLKAKKETATKVLEYSDEI
jgi:phosphoglycerol transferase MdoB-like AlkP superfamily enzyme